RSETLSASSRARAALTAAISTVKSATAGLHPTQVRKPLQKCQCGPVVDGARRHLDAPAPILAPHPHRQRRPEDQSVPVGSRDPFEHSPQGARVVVWSLAGEIGGAATGEADLCWIFLDLMHETGTNVEEQVGTHRSGFVPARFPMDHEGPFDVHSG